MTEATGIMHSVIGDTINELTDKVQKSTDANEIVDLSAAILNLAHAKAVLSSIKKDPS